MKTIWKYPLLIEAESKHIMKEGAKVLFLDLQDGIPCMWVLSETNNMPEERTFRIVGTGHPILSGEYVGTFQAPPFVWHVFEI